MQVQAESIQSVLLNQIREKVPPNLSFADEVAELLHISRDSAYRRIRGETILSLDEAKTLCNHFGISIDQLFTTGSPIVAFHRAAVSIDEGSIQGWLTSILKNLEYIKSFKQNELIYCAKDIPVFHYFRLPDMAAFKLMFWMKTLIGYPEYKDQKFKPEAMPNEMVQASGKVWDTYASLSSTEIWNEQTILATLRQIEFYYGCGFFESPTMARHLCDQLINVVDLVQTEATSGKKENGGLYSLYNNEILISDNTVLAKMDDKRCVFVNQMTLTILRTFQEPYCKQTEALLLNLIEKSILISKTGERQRSRFFNTLRDRIVAFKETFH